MTVHAEMEGMKYLDWFRDFLNFLQNKNVRFVTLNDIAEDCLREPSSVPRCEMIQGEVPNRSGQLAMQKNEDRS
jgi:hypothetical protein